MKAMRKEILVFADWVNISSPIMMGKLYSEIIRGKEVFSFQYSDEWLSSRYAQIIDPELHLYKGVHYLSSQKENFGVFLDSSPDRWGRLLMRRREAISARIEKREENTLFESDYLLGVFDDHRMGGLRFKEETAGSFLDNNKNFTVPPWATLNELADACRNIEKDDLYDDPDYAKWLNMLIAPGASLGGARPKASIKDDEGNLWIAKFPSINDEKNIAAWELVVHKLAKNSGINVSDAIIRKFSNSHHTFLTKRFDRKQGQRIHFSSAMTMLGYNDGDDFNEGVSYLEVAEFIIVNGGNVVNDLNELWKRIVFNIAVSNTDDHLRNHGFILTERGWILSPAYDINPIETGTGLKLNISENDNSLDFGLAMEVIDYFRLKEKTAQKIIEQISKIVSNWENVAREYEISRSERKLMEKAFRTI